MKRSENLLTLEVINQERLVGAVESALKSLGREFALSDDAAGGLARTAAEACRNAIRYAFDGEDVANVTVKAQQIGHKLVISVADQGLPFDGAVLEKTGRGGTGNQLMHTFADSVKVKNLGAQGMELILTKSLPVAANEELESAAAESPSADDLVYRLLGPDDALAISRCTYRTYGYTYVEEVYHPDMVAQGLQYGYLVSYGAAAPDGDLAAHLAVIKDDPEAPVGELGLGMVDPRYRGHGIFPKLMPPLMEEVKRQGMVGLFAETVTVHTITQRGKWALGWRETGVVLGYIGDRTFKAIEGGDSHQRQAIILFYGVLNPTPCQTVHISERHRGIAEKIYAELGLDREFGGNAPPQTEAGVVTVDSHPERGTAVIDVEKWGQDTTEQVKHHLKDLTVNRIDLIMLNLPMSCPATGAMLDELEKLGFFFAGIVPNLIGEDVLRLQYLNNVKVDPEVIKTHSEFAAELLQYVLKGANL